MPRGVPSVKHFCRGSAVARAAKFFFRCVERRTADTESMPPSTMPRPAARPCARRAARGRSRRRSASARCRRSPACRRRCAGSSPAGRRLRGGRLGGARRAATPRSPLRRAASSSHGLAQRARRLRARASSTTRRRGCGRRAASRSTRWPPACRSWRRKPLTVTSMPDRKVGLAQPPPQQRVGAPNSIAQLVTLPSLPLTST